MNTMSFPKMFNMNNGKMSTNLSYNYKSIHESLTSLLMTNPGELLGDPSYGCGLKQKLFDIKSNYNMTELRNIIIAAANKYIPQIIIRPLDIKIYSNDNTTQYKITIGFSLNNSDKTYNFEILV